MPQADIPNIYQASHQGTAPRFNRAFAQGCSGKVLIGPHLQPGPVALWGDPLLFEMLMKAKAEGRTWYYGDHAFFGKSKYFRITKNSIYLKHWRVGPDFERFEKCGVEIEPTKTDGDFILVCPPTESLSKRNGFTQNQWLETMRRRIAKYSNRPIVIRHKPKVKTISIREALEGAWALVTYTSNTAVEAICAGYPVFTTAECAAYPMARDDVRELESPLRWAVEQRRDFAAILAANQWTLTEIAAGMAWEKLR